MSSGDEMEQKLLERLTVVRGAVKRLLGWLDGFEESTLYEDYKKKEGFTDKEWGDTLWILDYFVDEDDEEVLA